MRYASFFLTAYSVPNDHSRWDFDKQNEQRQRRRDEAAEGTTWQLKHFAHQDDDPLCRSFFFSVAACLMSRSQTNVWASCSRQCRRPRTCTSIRTTLPRLKAHELGRGYLAWTAVPFNPILPSPPHLSVAGSREFDLVTCNTSSMRIWTWEVTSSVQRLRIEMWWQASKSHEYTVCDVEL